MLRRFVLDANVFMEAHRRYYPFDVCPGFWTELIRQHVARRLCSIDRIKQEIEEGKDQLNQWADEKAPEGFFKKTADRAIVSQFQKMVTWVTNHPQFNVEAKAEFADVADGWLVAYAKVNGLVIVTLEVYDSETKKKVPIPNVCREFNVDYVNTFDMLRELGVKLMAKKAGR